MKRTLFFAALLILTLSLQAETILVKNITEYSGAAKKVKAGDSIILANGAWTDAKLVLNATGTKEQPVVLCAQTKGKVTLEGESFLAIGGDYIIVSGLVFRNGHTPRQYVISFMTSGTSLANNCRVTNCVIDSYNQGQRDKSDNWVGMAGRNNRFDHNMLLNKLNEGTTLIVRLEEELSRENNHLIDHNYFGPRKRLGSNGGETIRVGTSTYSMSRSLTRVENNYFDRCNGEVEVISNKSCGNSYRNNVFFECEGSMVLRHGNDCLVEGNVFLGNNKDFTGGVRVIGENHTIVNNYFYQVRGESFRAPLSLMNGVPNSPLNRYFQVKNALVAYNTWVDCAPLEFGAGTSPERSLAPSSTRFLNNVIWKSDNTPSILALDKTDGISFAGNLFSTNLGITAEKGFRQIRVDLMPLSQTVKYPAIDKEKAVPVESISFDIAKQSRKKGDRPGALLTVEKKGLGFVTADSVKLAWYPPLEFTCTGSSRAVKPGLNTLQQAVNDARPCDTLLLEAGDYQFSEPVIIRQPVTIACPKANESMPVFHSIGPEVVEYFILENGGNVIFSNLHFSGSGLNGKVRYAVRTSTTGMLQAYFLKFEKCRFTDFTRDEKTSVFKAFKNTYADSLIFRNCIIEGVKGTAIDLSAETEDQGKYNAEYIIIEDSKITGVEQNALNLYRGGNDESTLGPFLRISNSEFSNIGSSGKNEILALTGVQWVNIVNTMFADSPNINTTFRLKGQNNQIKNCEIRNAGTPVLTEGAKRY